tara:strand:- start:2672 stop:3652 length:981 start_codon:yes stop_codon:yes gene_type:complete
MYNDYMDESLLQLNEKDELCHLLTLKNLDKTAIEKILDQAQIYTSSKIISDEERGFFQNLTVANLFFEPSTRTRGSFEIASRYLGCNVINIDIENSSEKKGESLIDTAKTIQSLGANVLIVRHGEQDTLRLITNEIGEHCIVINAGEANISHPTQGLLDLLTIRQEKKSFENLIITIIGDLSHSRVAQSTAQGLTTMGVREIRLVSPEQFSLDENISHVCRSLNNVDEGIKNADVVMALRIQHERINATGEEYTTQNYFEEFGLTHNRMKLASPDAIIMHPGPMNRNVEIESSLADSPKSVIQRQVANGVAVRMAVIDQLLKSRFK